METSLHEILHALVFSPGYGPGEQGLFVHFRDVSGNYHNGFTGNGDNLSFLNIFEGPHSIRGIETMLLVTPFVREWVANHFGCDRVKTETNSPYAGM